MGGSMSREQRVRFLAPTNMPRLSVAKVSLIVDGLALPEYRVVRESKHEVSCYVPSETGEVRCSALSNQPSIEYHTVVRQKFQIRLEDKGPKREKDTFIHLTNLEIDGGVPFPKLLLSHP
jgi:hypothetical protein